MTTHRARDEWADAQLGEALRRSLDSMAGYAGAVSSLDAALGTVRSRVRRRRAVKQAGIGATTLSTAGALVVGGATLLPAQDPTPPGPAQTSSPSPSEPAPTGEPAPTSEPSPDGSVSAVALIEDGYQPAWLEGTDLVCGMSAADLPASAEGFELKITGGLTSTTYPGAEGETDTVYWRLPTALDGTPPGLSTSGTLIGPTLLWVQDDRVVDVGINMTEDPTSLQPERGLDGLERTAEDSTSTSCAPGEAVEAGTSYPTGLPAGEYQVRAFDVLWTNDYTKSELIYSEPVTVVVE